MQNTIREVINIGDRLLPQGNYSRRRKAFAALNIPSENFNICHLQTGRVQDITLHALRCTLNFQDGYRFSKKESATSSKMRHRYLK